MAPPSYADLGKLARDLFQRGYHFGLWKLDCRTKTESGIEFNTSGKSEPEEGKVSGWLETIYRVNDYGLSLRERWNTESTLITEVAIQDKLAEGLRLALEASFQPKSGEKDGTFKLAYGQEIFKLDADCNIDLNGPPINFSLVLGHQNFLGGYKTIFDSANTQFTTHNFAIGYVAPEFAIHVALSNGEAQEGVASLYAKLAENVDAALQLSYKSEGDDTNVGIGARYFLEAESLIRAKVDTNGEIGLGYQQKLRDGVTFLIAGLIDSKNLKEGNHKIGVALEITA